MAKNTFMNVIAWLTAVIVSLSVGFGMIGGTLSLPTWLGGATLAMIAGWVVVIGTIISAVMAIIGAFSD
jgi:hypothetical protein